MSLAALAGLFRRSPALNAMRHRQRVVADIIKAYAPDAVVETGTYKAHSTLFFADRAKRVFTLELNPDFHAAAVAKLAGRSNVSCLLGSSDEILAGDALGLGGDDRIVFYLDAHWNEHLPLRRELELIRERYRNTIIVIDDFRVDGDDGYGFDDYGPVTGRLTLDYIEPVVKGTFKAWWPAVASSAETGKKRGWIVLANGSGVACVEGIAGLKPVANF
ncbi:MAG: class I SAM-dependent methyltransferase [Hyphomicrobiaceae bacterium]|nr:class I SAM-dependent methyltransferase [Hyphomicrobiaceae bacterium]